MWVAVCAQVFIVAQVELGMPAGGMRVVWVGDSADSIECRYP